MRKLNKLHYAGLVYCVIKDNCVSPKSLDRKCLKEVYECCRLNRSTSNSELEDALQVLVGSYLMQNTDGKYSLIHDSLFEIVAVHFGRCFQDFFIEHCTSTSIYNLLTFVDEGSTCCENLIPVFGNHFSVLVDRIICDIKRFNLYEVFSRIGQFSQNEAFVSVFYKTLKKSSYDEFKQLFFEVETNEHLNKKTKKLFHELDQICDNIFEAKKFSAIDFSLSLLNKPRVRVVDWIIAYNHVGLLSGLIKIVREKSQPVEEKACFTDENSQDILGVIFGNDLESHSFCLRLACSSRSLDMVKFILSCVKHESINYLDNQNQWPLMTASGAGCTDIVKILLKEGANVNLCDKDNFSCLNCSCLLGQYDVAETLIKEGADINLCTVDGMSPFKAAMMSGNVHLVRYLMKNGAVWNEDNLSPLHFSSYLGNLEILKHFINSDPELKIDVRCLSAACENGQSTIVKYLIDKVDVNEVCDECDPALHSAATSGHLAIVEYLVEHGADVNLLSSSKENPLYFAAMKGHLHIIRYLLDHGADICGSIDTSSLCVASGEGYLEVVEELIKRGADVNLCDRNEQSPLCYASKSGHLKTVKFLLQNDADINVGASCLSSACKGGHLDVVEFLINKVNVNQVSDICDPPIHCASGQGHIEVIKFLVDHEANVNLLNSSRDSPLCCAVGNRQLSVVEYLVEHGANVNQAIDIAIEVGQEHILDFMLKHLN
ncbi:ankyrin repeat domain-containing protein 50-like [Saccostrea cucullata]|uniref:ankyrin repeat domain-containing protein 50-like n=1 Tax=Saccostrea cuccullata TaxID=36930 RepID=UPI002ED48665